jgi:hypothetical protein
MNQVNSFPAYCSGQHMISRYNWWILHHHCIRCSPTTYTIALFNLCQIGSIIEKETGLTMTNNKKMERILVIDYEPDIAFSLNKVLEENRFACVDIFNDPADVISQYNNQPETS